MEKFKAVEKAMKTKAYSKEGLSAAAKLDPKEQAKVEMSEFLSGMVDELEQQIETLEAESESIGATMKKGKNQAAKAERIAEIERVIERHKFHQGKMELIRRSLENGAVDAEQVKELEESIRYYVTDGINEDFIEDEGLYDELDLEEEEGTYGMGGDNEKNSSQDGQSVQEEIAPEPELPKPRKTPKEPEATIARKPSAQTKSPLPALATLHTPLSAINNNITSSSMKPAQVPTRPAGEGLKYASAAAAAAASDKNNVGIAPLPPPPGSQAGISPLPPVQSKASATSSPAISTSQPVPAQQSESKQAPSSSAPTVPSSTSTPAPSEPEPAPIAVRGKKAKASSKLPPPPESTAESSKGQFSSLQSINSIVSYTDFRSSSVSNQWCDKRNQAYRGGTRGVDISPSGGSTRSRRIVRDHKEPFAASSIPGSGANDGSQPTERTHTNRRQLPASVSTGAAIVRRSVKLPQGAVTDIRRPSILHAGRLGYAVLRLLLSARDGVTISCSQGAERSKLALPQAVSDLVPAP